MSVGVPRAPTLQICNHGPRIREAISRRSDERLLLPVAQQVQGEVLQVVHALGGLLAGILSFNRLPRLLKILEQLEMRMDEGHCWVTIRAQEVVEHLSAVHILDGLVLLGEVDLQLQDLLGISSCGSRPPHTRVPPLD